MMAAPPEDRDRIVIQPLPEASSEYGRWRFSVKASILAASPDPILAMAYLAELDDPGTSMDDLARALALEMTKTDVKLFAALVGACKGTEGSKTVAKSKRRRDLDAAARPYVSSTPSSGTRPSTSR
jgi:hypothetical protein